jgi:hypothetical protein
MKIETPVGQKCSCYCQWNRGSLDSQDDLRFSDSRQNSCSSGVKVNKICFPSLLTLPCKSLCLSKTSFVKDGWQNVGAGKSY